MPLDEILILWPKFPRKYASIGLLRRKLIDDAEFEDSNDTIYRLSTLKDGQKVLLKSRNNPCSLAITISARIRPRV